MNDQLTMELMPDAVAKTFAEVEDCTINLKVVQGTCVNQKFNYARTLK